MVILWSAAVSIPVRGSQLSREHRPKKLLFLSLYNENDTFMTVPSMMIEIPESKTEHPRTSKLLDMFGSTWYGFKVSIYFYKRHKIGNEEISEIKAVSEALTPWCSG